MDLTGKCNEVLTALDDKIAELRRKPDEVCAKFASKYLRTQQDNPKDIRSRVCPAEAFERLADAMYRPREEDEAYVALQGKPLAATPGATEECAHRRAACCVLHAMSLAHSQMPRVYRLHRNAGTQIVAPCRQPAGRAGSQRCQERCVG